MSYCSPIRTLVAVLSVSLLASLLAPPASATGVPIGGFLPLVGLGLTDEFKDQSDPSFFRTTEK